MTRSRRILIAAAALALVLAVVVTVALVIPALVGGLVGPRADVFDISSEAQETWEFDWTGDNNPEFLDDSPGVTSIGPDRALVWPVFDYAKYSEDQGTALGWYEGYDQQYDEGYAAGLEYRAADAAYHADTFPYTVAPADPEDFFPEGAYDNHDEFLGFQDGFYDASLELGAGANKREKPVDPDFTPKATLLNAATGEALWTANLTGIIEGVDYQSAISAFDLVGSNAIAVVISSPNSETVGYSLVTLDRGNGHALSTISAEGQISVAAFDGDVIVSTVNATGENSTIGRYDVDRLDKKAQWEVTVAGRPFLSTHGDFVIAYDEDAGAVFNGSDGSTAAWGGDIDFSTSYQFVGTQLIRGESIEDGGEYEIQGWDVTGEATWESSVTADSVLILDGSIFAMQAKNSGFASLQRVNPIDGAEMWESPYASRFDAVVGAQGDSLLVARGDTIAVLDLATGRERNEQEVGDFVDVYQGEHLYYVPAGDELVAYSYTAEGPVWSLDLEPEQSVTTVGAFLALLDHPRSVLLGLAAR